MAVLYFVTYLLIFFHKYYDFVFIKWGSFYLNIFFGDKLDWFLIVFETIYFYHFLHNYYYFLDKYL